MDKLFKTDDLAEHYDEYVKFNSFKRKDHSTIDSINELDKLYNVVKKRGMQISECILAFNLIDAAMLSDMDRKFVLTGLDYTKKETLFEQTKLALRKYAGLYASSSSSSTAAVEVKVEPVFNAMNINTSEELEHTLAAHGFFRSERGRSRGRERSRGRSRGGSSRRNSPAPPPPPQQQQQQPQQKFEKKAIEKPLNPTKDNGERMICPSCGSYRHLLKDCPDSYENLQKKSEASGQLEDSLITNVIEIKESLLSNAGTLCMEASNKAVVDSACTANVCGEEWLDTYMDTLTEYEKALVTNEESNKHFRFGGGEILKSSGSVKIPCVLGEEKIMLRTDVV